MLTIDNIAKWPCELANPVAELAHRLVEREEVEIINGKLDL